METLFGKTKSGEDVHQIALEGGGLSANILTYGASVQNLRLVGHAPPLVLGFPTLEDYERHGRYFGATVGRFANRIANGRFEVDGVTHQTDQNFRNRHTLHGGEDGIGTRVWDIAEMAENAVTLTIKDPDGASGFPGTCHHTCTYRLEESGMLAVDYETVTDTPTIASLAHHSYFILDDTGSCLDHLFQIKARTYLPVDGDLIPTGETADVDATEFDFRAAKTIRNDVENGAILDHNFCLAPQRQNMAVCATVRSRQSGISMKVETTEPGLQFYAGHGINVPVTGIKGREYGPCAGFAMETQIWPDAPNHATFPNAIVRPGDICRQSTRYRFSKS